MGAFENSDDPDEILQICHVIESSKLYEGNLQR